MTNFPEEYEWSSYRAFIQQTLQPHWLYCDETLSYFGSKNNESRIVNYRNFINEGVDDDLLALLSCKKSQSILGSVEFVKSMAIKLKTIDPVEIPDQKPLIELLQPSLSTIQNVIRNYFQIDLEEITKSRQNLGNLPRRIAIYLASKHTSHSHQVIANFFGNTSRYGVTRIYHIVKQQLKSNPEMSKILLEIENNL
jgi:hypothetical protein